MSDRSHQPREIDERLLAGVSTPDGSQPGSPAAAVRCLADDELVDAAQPEGGLEALRQAASSCPTLSACVTFERSLRDRCGRVMSGEAERCPDVLADRLRAIAVDARTEDAGIENTSSDVEDAFASGVAARSAATRSSGFWAGGAVLGPRMLGLAASVLLLVGVGSLVAVVTGGGSSPVRDSQANPALRLASLLSNEHGRCELDTTVGKFSVTEESAAPEAMRNLVGVNFEVPSLSAVGLEFVRLGACGVPGGQAVHAQYRNSLGVSASLFVRAGMPADIEMRPGVLYTLSNDAVAEQGSMVYAWHENGVTFMLVSTAELCDKARRGIGLPEPSPRLIQG